MRIYPAIDLYEGDCVRLKNGCFDKRTVYYKDPVALVRQFEQAGFEYLHVVDLEGAKNGYIAQFLLIKKLLENTQLKVQVGGGIRTPEVIEDLIKAGADRIIIGSLAATHSHKVTHWIEYYGVDKIVLALDINLIQGEPIIAVRGWQETSGINLWELLTVYQHFEQLSILCTDVSKDGLLEGSNIRLYEGCSERFPRQRFLASGGVKSLAEIEALSSLTNIEGVILGTSLYEKYLSFEEVMNVS